MSVTPHPYYVYIVTCADGTLYTGITTDVIRRVQQHNGERKGGARYTKGKGPVQLVYVEPFASRSTAAQREYEIKHTLTRAEKEVLISR